MMVSVMVCGESAGPLCPTVPTELGVGWDADYSVRRAIDDAVKDLLADPGSYDRHGMSASGDAFDRDDGSRYYWLIEVDFSAANAFGGMVHGDAQVALLEREAEGCVVVIAELIE